MMIITSIDLHKTYYIILSCIKRISFCLTHYKTNYILPCNTIIFNFQSLYIYIYIVGVGPHKYGNISRARINAVVIHHSLGTSCSRVRS